MKRFAALFNAIDQSTKTTVKVAALADYFNDANDMDRLWTVALFSGRRPKRAVTTTRLREWAAEAAEIPLWLFEDSYAVVGDLAETIALVLPPNDTEDKSDLSFWINALRGLADVDELDRKTFVIDAWNRLGGTERFVFNKLITGGFRMGVSQKLMTRALSRATGKPEAELAHRLMGNWHPDDVTWHQLIEADDATADASRPYPFYLAYALEDGPDTLGDPQDWRAEWKWDGIRVQATSERGVSRIYSRTGDDISAAFPDLLDAIAFDGALDGELLIARPGSDGIETGTFSDLQQRLNRKTVTARQLRDYPAFFRAYDLLQDGAQDLRASPFLERRKRLEAFVAGFDPMRFDCSAMLTFDSWEELASLRANPPFPVIEGVMIKRKAAPYLPGRPKGEWFKWKRDPFLIDAVLMYAQRGHGKRSGYYSDYTFGVWRGPGELVPVGKAYFGFTDEELTQIDKYVRENTVERFGPVRSVRADADMGLVFEIAFEGINRSTRHKSGVAMRFPRINRLRWDKPPGEADRLETLERMIDASI